MSAGHYVFVCIVTQILVRMSPGFLLGGMPDRVVLRYLWSVSTVYLRCLKDVSRVS